MEKFESLSVWGSDTSFLKNKWKIAIYPSSKVDLNKLILRFPTAKIEKWDENPDRLYIYPVKGGEPKSIIQVLDFLGDEGWEPYENNDGKYHLKRKQ